MLTRLYWSDNAVVPLLTAVGSSKELPPVELVQRKQPGHLRLFLIMESFDPLTLLTLKYRGRSVAVLREKCLRHEVSPAHGILLVDRA